jgi:hypothetical protein
MNTKTRFLSAAILILLIATTGFSREIKIEYRETDVTIRDEDPYFSFVTYASMGGGHSKVRKEDLPLVEFSTGFQVAPWIAVGAFCAGNPLSDFEHAALGLHLADREASYALKSGTEILFTPQGEKFLHPLVRLALGGVSVGYLEDIDGEEGYERAIDNRYFYASISAGLEINLCKYCRLSLRGGWNFIDNENTLGLRAGELSAFEATLSIRALWKTTIYRHY